MLLGEALEELRESLDPENKDPQVSAEVFKEHLIKWSKKLAGSPQSESDFNRTPSQLNVIEDRELPYLHSTPRASLGDKLLRCQGLLNLSNVSGYSLSTSKLDATSNEEEIKKLQHQLSKTTNELTMLKTQLALSEEVNDTMQNDIERLNRRLIAEQQVNEQLQRDKLYNEELRDEITICRKTMDDLRKKLANSEKEILDYKAILNDLEQEKIKAEKKAELLSRQKQDILKENFEFKTEMESFQQKIEELKTTNEELKMKFRKQKDLIDQLRDENDILNHQRQTLEKALKGKTSFSPLEQDSPSPPLGNIMSTQTQTNGIAFNFPPPPPPANSRRKSKLPLLKNVLDKKKNTTNISSVPCSTPVEIISPQEQPLGSPKSDTLSPVIPNETQYQTAVGLNESRNSSEEDLFWKIHSTSKNSSGSGQNLESLQTEICKVHPTFKNDSTAIFENHEQIFMLEDEVNSLKQTLQELQAENNKLSKELKDKTISYEDLVSSNYVLATSLETTKYKVDHLQDLLNEKQAYKLDNILTDSKSVQTDIDDQMQKSVKDLHKKLKLTQINEKKCAEETAALMKEFGKLTMDKMDIESNLSTLQKQKNTCEQRFKEEIETIEKKLVTQENVISELNQYLTKVDQENEDLQSLVSGAKKNDNRQELVSSTKQNMLCLQNDLESLSEKNKELLELIAKLEDENNKKHYHFNEKIMAKEKEYLESLEILKNEIKQLRYDNKNDDKIKAMEQDYFGLIKSIEESDKQNKKNMQLIREDFEEKLNLKDQQINNLRLTLPKKEKSDLDQLKALQMENKRLLQCISDIEDDKIRKLHNFEEKVKEKDQEIFDLLKNLEDLGKQHKEQLESCKTICEDQIKVKEEMIINLTNIIDHLNKQMENSKAQYNEKLKRKEKQIIVLKENIEKDVKANLANKLENQKKDFEEKIHQKEQEINYLKENFEKQSVRNDLEKELSQELEKVLIQKESNWFTENLIKQLKTDYDEKIKTQNEEFQQKLNLKEEETAQYRENLEKRLMIEFEEKLKHSIDGEEKIFSLSTKCESLERQLNNALKNLSSKAAEYAKLEQQLKVAQQELVQLRSQKNNLEETIQNIQKSNKDLENTLSCQQKIVIQLKKDCRDSDCTVSELKNNILEANKTLQIIVTEKEKLKGINSEMQMQIINLKGDLKSKLLLKDKEMQKLKEELNERNLKLNDAELKIKKLIERGSSLEKDLNSTLHNLYDKENMYEKANTEWQNLESELKAMFAKKLNLEEKMIDLKENVENLTNINGILEKDKKLLEQKIKELRKKVETLESDVATFKLKNINLLDINNNKTKELEALHTLLNQEKNNSIANKTEIRHLKDLLEEKVNQLAKEKETITKTSAKCEETELVLKNVKSENSKLISSVKDLRNRNLAKEKDLESLNFALESEKTKLSLYCGEIALKDQEIKKLLLQLVEIKSLLANSENAYQILLNDVESKETQNINLKQELAQLKAFTENKLGVPKSTETLSRPIEKRTSFSKQQIALERLKERLEATESKLKNEKEKKQQLSVDFNDLKKCLYEKEDEIKSVITEKVTLEDIIDDLKNKLRREEIKTEDLDMKIRQLESQMKLFGDQNKIVQNELQKSPIVEDEELLEINKNIETAKKELYTLQNQIADNRCQLEIDRKELQITRENLLKAKEESQKCDARPKNKFTLRSPYVESSRPSSPDSPSNDFEVNGLPHTKAFYQSSNQFNLPECAVIEIPNFVFSDITDEFLCEIGLDEQSPRKKFSKKETEEKVTTLALRLFVNSKDVAERLERQKNVYRSKFEEIISLTTDLSYRLRDHVCIGTMEPISPVFVLLEELKLRVKALAQSATEMGILACESRMKRCWNLVTNYMAMLRKENDILSRTSTNLESTPIQTFRKRPTNATNTENEANPESPGPRRNLASKCRYAVMTMGFAAFLMSLAIALHIHCRLTVSTNQYCPLDDFITRKVTDFPPM